MTAGASRRRVHVVTVMYNSAQTISSFFAGIAAQGDVVQAVTVVDNGSRDGSVEEALGAAAAAGVEIRLVRGDNVGFARGYAAARSAHDGAAVLCVNPDVALAPGIVAQMVEVLDGSDDIGIVTSVLVGADGIEDTASRRRLPRLGGSVLYSVLGRLTPARFRYNSRPARAILSVAGHPVSDLEATTGALMLLRPGFRDITMPVFDTDYWMYGEDLQLCADARAVGLRTVILESTPSVHIKGASSGRPRTLRSNAAFHRAMYVYARKNLAPTTASRLVIAVGIGLRFVVWEGSGQVVKRSRSIRRLLTARQGRPAMVPARGTT